MNYKMYESITRGLEEKDSYYSWDRGIPFSEIEENWSIITKEDLYKILVDYDYAVSQSMDSHSIFNRIYDDFIQDFDYIAEEEEIPECDALYNLNVGEWQTKDELHKMYTYGATENYIDLDTYPTFEDWYYDIQVSGDMESKSEYLKRIHKD